MLAVLVVSCPCALSLAIPAVYAAASGRLASLGVLLAQPSVLATVPRLSEVLFDKTGTLTEPLLQLEITRALAEIPPPALQRIAAALERDLPHPIARALSAGHSEVRAQQLELLPEGGLSGWVDGCCYRLGPPERLGLSTPEENHLTWVALADAHRPLALFGLASRPRPEALETTRALRMQGLHLVMTSGDADAAVRSLAERLGIETAQARQTPEAKLAGLQQAQERGAVVMAVGDGINDAPLLAAADVGVAMPGGAALAQARADVILTSNSLDGLLHLRTVAAQAQQRVRENLAWALVYNLVMLPMAFSGALTPWLAALGMSLSSLVVVINALRLL
jgi:Cu2+-exporting ATPase